MRMIYAALVIMVIVSGAACANGAVMQPGQAVAPDETETLGSAPEPASPALSGAGPREQMAMPPHCMGLAVDDNAVYVLCGTTLYKLDKSTMQIINSVTLPIPQAPRPAAGGAGPVSTALVTSEYSRTQISSLLVDCTNMTPAQFEMNYLQVSTRAMAGAVEWSQLAVVKANHQELRQFARRVIDEHTSLGNKYSTWLSNWYNVTQLTEPLPQDEMVLERLRELTGREFEIVYMNAMISHLAEMDSLSRAVATSAPHQLLQQTALQAAVMFSAESNQLRQWLSDWYGMSR